MDSDMTVTTGAVRLLLQEQSGLGIYRLCNAFYRVIVIVFMSSFSKNVV